MGELFSHYNLSELTIQIFFPNENRDIQHAHILNVSKSNGKGESRSVLLITR